MGGQEHKANIRLIQDLFEGMLEPAQIEQWDHFFARLFASHGPVSGCTQEHELSSGREFNLRMAQMFKKRKLDVRRNFCNEDKVVICWTLRVTHKITEKELVISGNSVYRIAKGKIVEVWQSWDRLGNA